MGSSRAGDWVSRLFLGNRHLLTLGTLVLLVAGGSALTSLPRIEDPRITDRNPIVLTLLPGASATRVEALVTKKLEDELREVSEVKRIESTSRPGISLINLELEDWVDRDTNEAVFSKIRDRLADARTRLPPEALGPEFDDKRGAVAYSLVAALRWDRADDSGLGILRRLAEGLADDLRNIPGTENVRLFGEPVEEVTVIVDTDELSALGLDTADVARAVREADSKTPAGVMHAAERDVLIEVRGEVDSLERVRRIPLNGNATGATITLGEVAQVRKRWQEPPQELGLSEGRRTVFVAARVEPGVRLDAWGDAARRRVDELGAAIQPPLVVEVSFDQSRYTEERLGSLSGNLLAGAVVVVLVVLIGMGWRAAMVVGLALPLSASFALFGLTLFGQQIHQMTIFGLIIAIGLLIDNAIVVTDEVRQRLHRGLRPEGAVRAAVSHLFSPLLASTLTTVLGFMPIFLLPGNIGDFVGPIAISVVLALIASFGISMAIIAPMAGLFVRPTGTEGPRRWWRDGVNSDTLTRVYQRLLLAAVRRPVLTIGATLILPLGGFAAAGVLDNQFFPPAERDQFEVEIWLPQDASLARTRAYAGAVEAVIREEPGVKRVDWLVGGSFPSVYYNLVMDKDNEQSYAHGIVLTDSVQRVESLLSRLQAKLDQRFPRAQVVLQPFGQGPPFAAPVAFRITGPSLYALKRYGEELRRVMHLHPDILHTQASIQGGEPKLWLEADEVEGRLSGITLGSMAEQLQGNLQGRIGGSMLEDLEELPVRVRFSSEARRSLEEISSTKLLPSGNEQNREWIPVSALGEMRLRPELGSITRRNGERVNNVLGYVAEGTLAIEVTREILASLEREGFKLPDGYRLAVSGESEEQQRAVGQLATYLPVLIMLMVASVVLSFRSALLGLQIITVAGLSVGLGLLSLWAAGFPLGFNPLLGLAGLVGVAINGTIVVLAAVRADDAARAGNAQAIVRETVGTTRHILSTTLTTIGGFLPLLLLTGGDFWPPLAVVIAGGVGLTMSLSLLYTPSLYYLLANAGPSRRRLLGAAWATG